MKTIALLLLLLCVHNAQSKARDLDTERNLYVQTTTLKALSLDDVQKSTLRAIIQNAELDKRIDAEYEDGAKYAIGDTSRSIPYTGNEILHITINNEMNSESFTLKPTYLAYGSDLILRSISFESQEKRARTKARLILFLEDGGKSAPTQLYYELVIKTEGKEIYMELSKDWQIIKAIETKQKRRPFLGNDVMEVSGFLPDQAQEIIR
ncbi:hypothetical protein [Pseudoalteromonas sp. JC3]|uniref:hypothetical protein n=1 Tax=Pseudoalteromonas sp. JC3 TaxID=2810196 RepID=UPI0019D0B0E6|nr:hypothetical protein [Pseudoalteromonas sp. JC3]MBR8844314.1 hypothetical protein [Pseudoalteromonas sp. JC3]WJE10903.1 hypothetical protein QSH61_22730 [Pseudoalteromonas sp. JC3]